MMTMMMMMEAGRGAAFFLAPGSFFSHPLACIPAAGCNTPKPRTRKTPGLQHKPPPLLRGSMFQGLQQGRGTSGLLSGPKLLLC